MLILPADAEDPAIDGVIDRMGQVLREAGGEITNVDRWGRRRLAYDIGRQSEGYCLVVDCLGDPGSMRELDRVLALADQVMRFKVVVRGEAETSAAREASAP